MITEDYVSFETAKLLKDKGFDEPCYQYYMTTKTLHTTFHNRLHVEEEPFFNSSGVEGLYEVQDKTLFEDICSAPTLQMAMKWLDEVHNIKVQLAFHPVKSDYGWYACLLQIQPKEDGDYSVKSHILPKTDLSYKRTCETAIKYCLENWI